MKVVKSLAMILSLSLVLTGCGVASTKDEASKTKTTEEFIDTVEMKELEKTPVEEPLSHFSAELFRYAGSRDGNTLISPYSVLNALAMTSCGADGKTLTEFQELLNMNPEDLSEELKNLREHAGEAEGYRLYLANNIWINEEAGFEISHEFESLTQKYFGSQVESMAFDVSGVEKINGWVDENTDHMIPKIINELKDDTIMILANALSFQGDWSEPYLKTDIFNSKFTTDKGTKIDREFMSSKEWIYLEDEDTVGFIKPYKSDRYAFVALLPKEGTDINEYVENFTEQKMNGLLNSQENRVVYSQMPKFKVEDGLQLKNPLMSMGLISPWDGGRADFTKMGKTNIGNLYLDSALHKTFIEVDELGTRAGAVTLEMMEEAADFDEDAKKVKLNRPFVYLIIDCENNLPIFMGKYVGEEA